MGPNASVRHTVSVIADDLTGAIDSVVQFQQAGWTAYLLLVRQLPDQVKDQIGPVATALSLDTRALSEDGAAQETARVIVEQLAMGVERIYLKIDSTMRGSVAGQVTGALEAWSRQHPDTLAVICPAYPVMGRVIRQGRLLVNGLPVERSAAGSDPVTPVSTSILSELIPGAIPIGSAPNAADLADRLIQAGRPSGRVVVDAADEDDLRRIADAVQLLGARAVCVGSAGLARHLARTWLDDAVAPVTGPNAYASCGQIVICITSLNEVSIAQANDLARSLGDRIVRHELDPSELSDLARARDRGRVVAANSFKDVVLLQPREQRVVAADRGATARLIAQGMATVVAMLVDMRDVSGLVLVGGDGAEATLRLLDASALRVEGQASEGVPLSRVVGGPAEGLAVATKAGGFGTVGTLTDVVSAILEPMEVHDD